MLLLQRWTERFLVAGEPVEERKRNVEEALKSWMKFGLETRIASHV